MRTSKYYFFKSEVTMCGDQTIANDYDRRRIESV